MADESRFRYRRDDALASTPQNARRPSPAGYAAPRGPMPAAPSSLTPPDLSTLPRVAPARSLTRAPAPPAPAPEAEPDGDSPLAELARLIGDQDPFADFNELPPVAASAARATQARAPSAPAADRIQPPALPARTERRYGDWPATPSRDVDLPPLRYGRRAQPEAPVPAADDGQGFDNDRSYRSEATPAPSAWDDGASADQDADTAHDDARDLPASSATPGYDSRIRRAGAALSGGGRGPLSRLGSVRDSLLKSPPEAPSRPAVPALPEPPAAIDPPVGRDLAATRARLSQPPSEPVYPASATSVKTGYGSLSRPTPAAPASDFDADDGASIYDDEPRGALRRPSAYDDEFDDRLPSAEGRDGPSRFERSPYARDRFERSDYDRPDDDGADYGRPADARSDYERRDYEFSDDRPAAGEASTDAAGYAYSAERRDDGYDDYDEEYDPEFAEDGYMPPHGEEVYDAEPRKRRGRMALLLVASLVGLIVAGTAGVFAYRMALGPARTTSSGDMPPVIRADSAPSKIASSPSAPAAGEPQPKLIYDQAGGDAGGKEKMVPREEQPVDVTSAATAPAATPEPEPAAPVSAPQPSPTEPKRVRTLTVRADGSISPVGAADAGSSVAAYAAPQNPIPTGLPAPKTVTTVPAGAAQSRSTAPAPAPAAPVTQEANARSTTADAPTSATGAYVVQVASQRSQADAMGSWRALQARYPNLLGSYQATVKRADLKERGIYYRAQVGPFASKNEANNLCQALRAQGGDCVVTPN